MINLESKPSPRCVWRTFSLSSPHSLKTSRTIWSVFLTRTKRPLEKWVVNPSMRAETSQRGNDRHEGEGPEVGLIIGERLKSMRRHRVRLEPAVAILQHRMTLLKRICWLQLRMPKTREPTRTLLLKRVVWFLPSMWFRTILSLLSIKVQLTRLLVFRVQ